MGCLLVILLREDLKTLAGVSRFMIQPRSYAFILPRFGEGIAGGAETLVGTLVRKLNGRGDNVQVLTTCARDNRTWANDYPPGDAVEYGVRVKRFAVDERNLDVWIPLQIKISEGKTLSLDEQFAWWQEGVGSKQLYNYLATRGRSYDLLFFVPYLFGTTFWGSLIHPDKSVLIPCLHDEHYAYLDSVASMMRLVRGCMFNAEPEMQLARRLYGNIEGGVVGMGFDPINEDESAEPFFNEPFSYVLYLGRKETGKNAHLLVDWFCSAKREGLIPGDLKLVIAGAGSFSDLNRPNALTREDILDIGHTTEQEKSRLLKHAVCLCQPSTNESFSIVIMESWQHGTPVIVHGECAVTRHHVVESGGGLYASNPSDFGATLRELQNSSELRAELGNNGREYVRTKYAWDAVLRRFNTTTKAILGSGIDSSGPQAGLSGTIG